MVQKRVGFIGFDDVQGLDIIGPAESFAAAISDSGNGRPSNLYETVIVGLDDRPFRTEAGMLIHPQATIDAVDELDTLIIPGGKALRNGDTGARIAEWLLQRGAGIRRIASVCTGAYALALTGWLDGKRVTTHWRFADDLGRRFPKLTVDHDALFIRNGKFYTAAGITAGIDLSLALIEEDHGAHVALAVARELVVYMKRAGGQEQFSEPLRFQLQTSDSFSDLTAWMTDHLGHDLSVDCLAERANLCPRHFSRRFKKAYGTTPAQFVETIRLNESRARLTETLNTVEGVALSIGFNSARAFRRAFEHRFGISPTAYRDRFAVRLNATSGKEK